MINSLDNITLPGIQNGLSKLQKNASQIVSVTAMEGENTQSLIEAVVDLKANTMQVSASMKVLNIANELIGTILDTRA